MDLTIEAVTDRLQRSAGDFSAAAGEAPERALEIMSALARPRQLSELLRSLRASPQIAAECATKSYKHPLGFDKILLIDSYPAFKLRLHAWWPGNDPSTPHVHDHRYGLASTIVRGEYHMQLFQRDQSGNPMTEYREVYTGGQSGWNLETIGNARLQRLASVSFYAGSSYAIAASALHRIIVPPDAMCVTLFLETLSAESSTHVFAEPGIAVPPVTPMRTLTSDGYEQRLDAVLGALAE
jgi:hypothetical protein